MASRWHKDSRMRKKNYDAVQFPQSLGEPGQLWFIYQVMGQWFSSMLPKHCCLDLVWMLCQDTPGSNSWVESCVCCFAYSLTVPRPQDLGTEIEQKVWIWTNPVREVVQTGFYATLHASMSCARLATVLHPIAQIALSADLIAASIATLLRAPGQYQKNSSLGEKAETSSVWCKFGCTNPDM